jgi:hypothetical protein
MYAQEHAREWVPPLAAAEAIERVLRNYAIDLRTRRFVNQLEIFWLPSANPDGGHYSFFGTNYDGTFNANESQRRSMTNHCGIDAVDPGARTGWGVDNNRNYSYMSRFDGYSGASASCTSDNYSGPAELSEPESANVAAVPMMFPNIRFSMNMHSSGNYFMWSPGAYKTTASATAVGQTCATPCRELAPRPDVGTEAYFWAASNHILTEIKRHRNLAVTPARTGPVADVLYSAAGNSGDHMYYGHDLFAWNFEVGGAGFQPAWAEAHEQTMEFANGLYGLIDVAYAYDHDHKRPTSQLVLSSGGPGITNVRFKTSEPAVVYYTTDGSRPTYASPKLQVAGDREAAQTFNITTPTTFHWFSIDMAGLIERDYRPEGFRNTNYNRQTVTPTLP